MTVEDGPKEGNTENIFSFSFTNIPNTGSVKILKKVDGELTGGFKINVTAEGSTTPAGTGSTVLTGNDKGSVTITNLPVYDSQGQKIVYTISEEMTPEQEQLYYQSSEDQTVTLTLGQVTTTDNSENPKELVVENSTLIEITAEKHKKYRWESEYTGLVYFMPGVVIGLYELDEEENVWKHVKISETEYANGTTGSMGDVGFGPKETSSNYVHVDLYRDKQYVLVEMSSPDPKFGPSGKEYPTGDALESIPAAQLSRYSYLETSAFLTDTTKTSFYFGTMMNLDHWVQFDVYKWLDHRTYRPGAGETKEQYEDTADIESNDAGEDPYDNAVFTLWRYPNVADGTELPVPPAGGWQKVDSYTSGTKTDANGDHISGQFLTDVEQTIDESYVYLLVEDDAGPNGGVIYDSQKYTLLTTASRSNVSIAGVAERHLYYELDKQKRLDVNNAHPVGEGGGHILLASVRLGKWRDSYDANWQPEGDYKPLPNAVFELRIPGTEKVIARMTTGLDAANQNAWSAISGTYQLILDAPVDGVVKTGTLVDYENSQSRFAVDVITLNHATYTIYAVETLLYEVDAPDGYGYQETPYPMYLCFVDSGSASTWVYNDAFYVTTAQDTTAALAEGHTDYAWKVTGVNDSTISAGSDHLRIVDYPTLNTPVLIQKYGYKPSASTIGLTSVQLDQLGIHRDPLGEVKMQLQRLDDDGTNWVNYPFPGSSDGTFVTDRDSGTFRIPNGLQPGTYRVYELEMQNETDAALYEMAYSDPGNDHPHSRVFFVGGQSMTVTMYNPEKISLTIHKQDMSGYPLEGVAFKLGTLDPTTVQNGDYTFSLIESGTYQLTETKAGYSSAYLEKYLTSQYGTDDEEADEWIADLVSASGTLVGYTYTVKNIDADGKQKDVVVSISPAQLISGEAELELTIQNPQKGYLKLLKTDDSTPAQPVSGASFIGWYRPFDSVEGTTDLTQADLTTRIGLRTAGFIRTDTATAVGKKLDGNTGSDGYLPTLTDYLLEPGIYVFAETAAPAGYEKLMPTAEGAQDVYYFAIIKGGMNVSVTGLPATTATTNGNVQTLFDTAVQDTISINVTNRKMVTMNGLKIINSGALPEEAGINWTVVLVAYDDLDTAKAATGVPTNNTHVVGRTANIRQNTSQTSEGVPFVQPNASGSTTSTKAYFSKGKTYYLREFVTSPQTGSGNVNIELSGILLGGNELALAEGTTDVYQFTASNDNMLVSVTNDYLMGYVLFSKRDTNLLNPTYLSGAKFEVLYEQESGSGVFVPLGNSYVGAYKQNGQEVEGVYFAKIPLVSKEPTKYRIHEITPPDGFIIDPNNDYIEVTLSLDDNYKDRESDLHLTDPSGTVLTITKYDNIPTANYGTVEEDEVSFTLLHGTPKEEGGLTWTKVETDSVKATNDQGKITWTLTPGEVYGFYESSYNHNNYSGLHTVKVDGTVRDPSSVYTDNGVEYPVYVLTNQDTSNDEYKIEVEAFNIPKAATRIIKKDAGAWPTDVVPMMDFSIYEIMDNETITDANVAAYMIAENLVLSETTSVEDAANHQTYYDWNGRSVLKRYLVVETEVGKAAPADPNIHYDTLNKDDARVKWYKVIEPETSPDGTRMDVVLENVYGEASVSLVKTVDKTAVESMLLFDDAGCELTYTLTPTVESHNQPLKTFTLTEEGLSFEQDTGNDYSGPVPSYSIKSVTIGKATQSVDNFKVDVGEAVVSAVITFEKKDGSTEQVLVRNLSADTEPIAAPSGSVKFTISYFSEAVQTATTEAGATDSIYALGYDFNPGPVTVKVTVDKLPDGNSSKPVAEVTSFYNNAEAALTYPKWNKTGTERSLVEPDPAEVSVTTTVGSFELPKVSVTKTANPPDAIQPKGVMIYTITVKNESTTQNFKNPVVLDILPSGVRVPSEKPLSEWFSFTQGKYGEVITLVGEPSYYQGAVTVPGGDSETAVAFAFEGELTPNSDFTITITANVAESVAMYGNTVQNDVYLSSSYHSFHTKDNKYGYSFTDSDGEKPVLLDAAAENINARAKSREHAMTGTLGSYEGTDFAWVATHADVQVNAYSSMLIVKAVKGDQDTSYSEAADFLGTSTRTNSTPGKETNGSVDYRLVVENNNATDRYYLVVGDVLPNKDDSIGSMWNAVFDSITLAKIGETPKSYTLYYYTGTPGASAKTALETAMKSCNEWEPDHQAWPEVGGDEPAENWIKASAFNGNKEDITAFLMIFDKDVKLLKEETLVVTYHCTTENITSDSEFATRGSFQNANNEFEFYYGSAQQTQVSNLVTVILTDGKVAVEGDLWIDEDQDGTQEENGNRRDYSEWAVIQKLLGKNGQDQDRVTFSITDQRINGGHFTSYDDKHGDNSTGIGESIKHFRFEELGMAMQKDIDLYDGDELRIAALKTTDPFVYSLNANFDLSGTELASIFSLSQRKDGYYMSDNPDAIDTDATVKANALDSNFFNSSNMENYTIGTNPLVTKNFFLRYSTKTDQSKDIGLRMNRALTLTKLDSLTDKPIGGAEFKVYGPFEENKGASGTVSDTNLIGTYTTDEDDGSFTTDDLNWWKEYIFVETKAAQYYSLDNAVATADDTVTVIEEIAGGIVIEGVTYPAWVLKLPVKTRETKHDVVTVKNTLEMEGEWTPKALKVLNGRTLEAGEFTFSLYQVTTDEQGNTTETLVQGAVPNDSDGKVTFDTIKYTQADLTFAPDGSGSAEFHYYIVEDSGTLSSVSYDDKQVNITVTVETKDPTDPASGDLDELIVTADPDPETAPAAFTFTNTYTPDPVAVQPPVKKTISGETPVKDTTFTFSLVYDANQTGNGDLSNIKLKDGDTYVDFHALTTTITIGANGIIEGTANFEEIWFVDDGTYYFTVTETGPIGDPNYPEIDSKVYTYKVVVTDNTSTGKLEATGGYSLDNQPVTGPAAFINKYVPTPTTQVLKVKKLLDGEPLVDPETKEYQFSLVASDSESTNSTGYMLTDPTEVTINGQEAAAETIKNFGTITFSKAGTYVFHITEVPPTDYNHDVWEYDDTLWKVFVTIEDNGGDLTVKETKYLNTKTGDYSTADTATAEFTNKYDPTDTDYLPLVTKKIAGHERPEQNKKIFTFTLSADKNNPEGSALPADCEVTITDAGGPVPFDGVIFFTKAGTYTFYIDETAGTDTGYTYDTVQWTLTVTVTDKNEELQVEEAKYEREIDGTTDVSYGVKDFKLVADAIGAAFTNTYVPEPTEYQPSVEKNIPGHPTVKEKTFEFTMKLKSEDSVTNTLEDPQLPGSSLNGDDELTTSITVPVGASNATNVFDKIEFTKAGKYVFEIKETVPDDKLPGITYDVTTWELEIVVEDKDGKLEVTGHNYTGGNLSDDAKAIFNNPYVPEPTEYTPVVEKTTQGPVGVKEMTFEFTMKLKSEDSVTNTLEDPQLPGSSLNGDDEWKASITIKAGKETDKTEFDQIEFTKAGTYVFEIRETVVADSKTIIYDETVWTLTVTVTDGDGKLTAKAEYTAAGKTKSTEKATFENIYRTGDLEVKKSVKGEEADKDKMFTFTVYLYDAEGNPLQGNYEIYIQYKNKETYAGDVENGTAVFKLKHDMTAVIVGIPIDATWKVVEEKYIHYYPGKTEDTGTIQESGNESVWINKWTDNPPGTGNDTNLILWGSLLGVSGIGIALLVVFAKKRKKEENGSSES